MEQEDGKEDAGKVGDRKAAFKGSEDKLTAVNYKAEESRFLEMLRQNCGLKLTEEQKAAVVHKDGPAL